MTYVEVATDEAWHKLCMLCDDPEGCDTHSFAKSNKSGITRLHQRVIPTVSKCKRRMEMSSKVIVERFDPLLEGYLRQWIENRAKRTGEKYRVVERYVTGANQWERALLRAKDGSTLRIFYEGYNWRKS